MAPHPHPDRSGARLLAHLVGLDDVFQLEVAVVAERETTLETFADLGGVVLEPLERADREVLRDHLAVAEQARPGVAADLARQDHATRDRADLGGLEDVADLGAAELDLFVLRLEETLEGRLDLVDRLVDDRVVADVDALAVRELGRLALGPDVEAQDDGGGGHGEVDVAFGDATDTAVDHAQFDVVADLDLHERVLEGLDGTRVVTLDDQGELAGFLERCVQVLEADA